MADCSTASKVGSTNKLTLAPKPLIRRIWSRKRCPPAATSKPPSVVTSSRFSGTRQHAFGCTRSAMAIISSLAAISKFSGASIDSFNRKISASRIWRRSSRRCAVIPCAPAAMAVCAPITGSGCQPPRAFRTVAMWSILTPKRTGSPTADLIREC